MHRYEINWLSVASAMLIIALIYSGYQTFALGDATSSRTTMIDPEKVE